MIPRAAPVRPLEAEYRFSRVYDQYGAVGNVEDIREGDVIIVSSLPSWLALSDSERQIVVAHYSYDPLTHSITVEPADPLPSLQSLIVGG